MSKQSSIEWLFAHLVPHLDWSKVEDRELFRKLKAEAQQMHKEEIVKAFEKGYDDFEILKYDDFEQYYNETYGGNHIVDTNEMIDHIGDANKMVEISDDEIEQKSVEYSTDTATKDFCEPCCHDFQNGAKWYREQLKRSNNT